MSIMKTHFAFKKIRLATSWRTRFYQNNHNWLGFHNTTSHKPIVYKRCLFNILTNIMDFVSLDDLNVFYKINGANQRTDLLCLFSPNSFKFPCILQPQLWPVSKFLSIPGRDKENMSYPGQQPEEKLMLCILSPEKLF